MYLSKTCLLLKTLCKSYSIMKLYFIKFWRVNIILKTHLLIISILIETEYKNVNYSIHYVSSSRPLVMQNYIRVTKWRICLHSSDDIEDKFYKRFHDFKLESCSLLSTENTVRSVSGAHCDGRHCAVPDAKPIPVPVAVLGQPYQRKTWGKSSVGPNSHPAV